MSEKFWHNVVAGLAGGLITAGGSYAAQLHQADVERQKMEVEAKRQVEQDERRSVELIFGAFTDLGDVLRRAASYAEGGRDGTIDDARIVFRHFDRVMREIRAGMVTKESIGRYYGNELYAWGQRFIAIGEMSAPGSKKLSPYEQHNFGTLGKALLQLSKEVELASDETGTASDATADTAAGNYGDVANDTMTASNSGNTM